MKKMKRINSKDLLNQQLQNEEFKEEFDALEEEFALAKEIIQLRQQAHLTQKQLADMAGTSQPAIARLESGEYKNITLTVLRKIGKALGAVPEVHFRKINKV